MHVMGKFDWGRDWLQGMDLREKVQPEGLQNHCTLQVGKAFCIGVMRLVS